ncbi:MAG TPA: formate dehydrogenase accessory protein FdhE [Thermoanaerobaculia bacterium]
MKPLTRAGWVEAHAYLRPVASLCAAVEGAAREIPIAGATAPAWEDYDPDFRAGVPLLASDAAAIDRAPAGEATAALAATLAESLSGPFAEDALVLDETLRRLRPGAGRIVDWLLGEDDLAPPAPGLLRYLGWTATSRYLAPVVEAFDRRRNDELWLRRYCPTCASPPAMAQLLGTDPGRKRLLACGGCRTRWQFPRTKCPFCENDSQKLSVVTVEGEAGLRIDFCEPCGGYLKTYDGQGNEALLLSDWSSLHLDLIAHDRGLKRRAASLFALDWAAGPDAGNAPADG